jgi:ribokinase
MPADTDAVRDLLTCVDVLVVNEAEAAALEPGTGERDVHGWQEVATRLRSLGPDVVVVTLGSQGAVAATAGGTLHQPPFPVQAVDTTGAGDVFCAALAVGLATGRSVPAAVRHACAAGALATTMAGAQDGAPTADAVDHLLLTAEAV